MLVYPAALFQRCNNIVDVQTTLLQRQHDVVRTG